MENAADKKHIRELVIYGVVGISTTVVNLFVYQILLFLNLNYKTANLAALIASKLYGYVANKNFVFHSHCSSVKALCKEIAKFIFTRALTGVIDYVGLIMSVEILMLDKVLSKYFIQVVVIILNFVFGKFLVFSDK